MFEPGDWDEIEDNCDNNTCYEPSDLLRKVVIIVSDFYRLFPVSYELSLCKLVGIQCAQLWKLCLGGSFC